MKYRAVHAKQIVLRIETFRSDGRPDTLSYLGDSDVSELSADPKENQFLIAYADEMSAFFIPNPDRVPDSQKDPE